MTAAPGYGLSEDDDIRIVSHTVERVADAMADLSTQLEQVTRRIGHVEAQRASEAEVGDVLLQAQRFSDEVADEADGRARAVVAQANAEAVRILEEARHQAAEIVAESRRSTITVEALFELTTAIDAFARNNRELLVELEALRATLAPPDPG